MKFTLAASLSLSLALSASAYPVAFLRRQASTGQDLSASQIAALAPSLGFQSGVNPDGTGSCDGAVDGANGQPIKIPCSCPPDNTVYVNALVANVQAGHQVNNTGVLTNFPSDDSVASQQARITTALETLQNLFAAGKGCPAVSTTLQAQSKALQDGTAPPAAASPTAAAASTPAAAAPAAASPSAADAAAAAVPSASALTLDQVNALAPDLGFQSGVNPDGTGSCDGAVNGANGQPIKIPCTCPPARELYVADLFANIQAGHQVNNTGVLVNFPTDDSVASQQARITVALETLQNLFAAGKGCPAVSTTLQAQSKALQDGTATPAAASPTAAAATTAAAAAPAAASPSAADAAAAAVPSSASALTLDQVNALAPDLGFQSGVNPDGTGSCDGAVNGANGQPIKIPCSCPPARALYVADLFANIQAGHQVNNTGVLVNFPTDNSVASQQARITAAIETLQNLEGPGKGCPAVSTTLQAQSKALGN